MNIELYATIKILILLQIVTNMVLAVISVGVFGLVYVALSATGVGIADTHVRHTRYYDYSRIDETGLVCHLRCE